MSQKWSVIFSKKSSKLVRALPDKVLKLLNVLTWEIEHHGPVRGDWPNYSKLEPGRHHCHLNKKGRPTYVAVWEEEKLEIRLVEVKYVGSRENAPY